MRQVGDIGLSYEEQASHFSLWALMASPLLIGADITALDNDALSILNNTEIISINQDALGHQGTPVGSGAKDPATAPCWAKKLDNNDVAALVLNTNDDPGSNVTVSCTLKDLLGKDVGAVKVRDVRNHKDLGPMAAGSSITAELGSHVHAMYRITPSS